jgi:hypothetical protein
MVKTKKLSATQERVMKWINGGWTIWCTRGAVVECNGKRICNLDTVMVLERLRLIKKDGSRAWVKA